MFARSRALPLVSCILCIAILVAKGDSSNHFTWWGVFTIALYDAVSAALALANNSAMLHTFEINWWLVPTTCEIVVVIGVIMMSALDCDALKRACREYGAVTYAVANFMVHYYPTTRMLLTRPKDTLTSTSYYTLDFVHTQRGPAARFTPRTPEAQPIVVYADNSKHGPAPNTPLAKHIINDAFVGDAHSANDIGPKVNYTATSQNFTPTQKETFLAAAQKHPQKWGGRLPEPLRDAPRQLAIAAAIIVTYVLYYQPRTIYECNISRGATVIGLVAPIIALNAITPEFTALFANKSS